MHIGKRSLEFQYQMSDGWVKSVDEKKNLGELMSKYLKLWKQSLLPKNKANLIWGIINRGVSYKSAEVIIKLYRSYVRPNLQYCIQFWTPLIEKVGYVFSKI